MRVISDYVNAKVEQNMVLDLRGKLFAHVESLSLTFHDQRQTGALMSIINLQAAAVGAIVMSFPPLFESFLMLIGMLIIALFITLTVGWNAPTARSVALDNQGHTLTQHVLNLATWSCQPGMIYCEWPCAV